MTEKYKMSYTVHVKQNGLITPVGFADASLEGALLHYSTVGFGGVVADFPTYILYVIKKIVSDRMCNLQSYTYFENVTCQLSLFVFGRRAFIIGIVISRCLFLRMMNNRVVPYHTTPFDIIL